MEILEGKLSKHIYQILLKAEIQTLNYFLLNSKQEICDRTRLTLKDVNNIINLVSEIILNQNFKTVYSLKNEKWPVLYTGCPIIDKTINGFAIKGITELFGDSATGKTQIALQLAIQVQKPEEIGGLNGGTVYISTEDSFPSKRLKEMIEISNEPEKNYLDNIFVEQIYELDKLKHCLSIRLPVLLSKCKIKLIIIDSITSVFRFDNESNDFITRSEDLKQIASNLNNLSKAYKLAIICINQVTADPKFGLKPCLGLTWSNLIRTRIQLLRTTQCIIVDEQSLVVRRIRVIFSPDVANQDCLFVITNKGVNGIER